MRHTPLHAVLVLAAAPVLAGHAAEPAWTLAAATQRAAEVAPELRGAQAQVRVRAGELEAAKAWPNPIVELRADGRLGLEEGNGGTDLTQVALTQPLPLWRHRHQVRAGEAALRGAQMATAEQGLLLEHETARAFHALQLAAARRDLAEQRLAVATEIGRPARAKTPGVVRYLTPTERARLAILVEQSRQELQGAAAQHEQAAERFRALLALPDPEPGVALLAPPDEPVALRDLETRLATHPELVRIGHEIDAAGAGVDAARAARLADPTISVFRERDFIGGTRQDYSGIVLGIQVPLWNRNPGPAERARGELERARSARAAAERNARSRLRQAHAGLTERLARAAHQREAIRIPAERLLDLTRRSFAAGEANALALIDAYQTYFEARARELELVAEASIAAADLRLAAGISLAESAP